ncbi:hypothetical protein ACP70R_014608 [Stipagrostis hirtigluma subsp. patula]
MVPPPALMEELVEEILLRFPPDDPASLLRAALVCKDWCRLVSGAAFRRRFREFHCTPPMLGFVYRSGGHTRFMPTTSCPPPYADLPADWWPIDACHGRILFYDNCAPPRSWPRDLIVCHPIMGDVQRVPTPRRPHMNYLWTAALLCAEAGCDHLDCPCGPFHLVLLVTDTSKMFTSAFVYSSEALTWSETTNVEHPPGLLVKGRPPALVGNALYFHLQGSTGILEYDVSKQELSLTRLPSVCKMWMWWPPTLMTAEDGGLGFVTVEEEKLIMWSREAGQNGRGWVQCRVIELNTLLPVNSVTVSPEVVAYADGVHIVLWSIDVGVFDIHLKLGRVTKVVEIKDSFYDVFPYLSFYTPRCANYDQTLEVGGEDYVLQMLDMLRVLI